METIIRIRKNKPALKALILLARELQKTDDTSISVKDVSDFYQLQQELALIKPKRSKIDLAKLLNMIADFPTIGELRRIAWKKNS